MSTEHLGTAAGVPGLSEVTVDPGGAVRGPGSTSATHLNQPQEGVQWANSELSTIASTIAELQNRLAEANDRLTHSSKVETTEVEIGRLFVEAQRYSEESLARLEQQVHQVLHEAQAKAEQIIAEANEEAQAIRRQAHQSAFVSTQAAQDLQTAIAGFTGVNSALVKELGQLNAMLAPEIAHNDAGADAAFAPPGTSLPGRTNGSGHPVDTRPS